ncbi:MAG: EutN/CcmL family microcompartment protein [Armatimonadetes bacterium]|nr:EutN/CcmL family microcompartment protein [Armatimonadota bacterium]
MIIGKVIGNLWATIQEENFKGAKLLLVEPLNILNDQAENNVVVAIDLVDAGIGDRVLVVYEGGSSRLALKNEKTPCEAIIVGIVDKIDF